MAFSKTILFIFFAVTMILVQGMPRLSRGASTDDSCDNFVCENGGTCLSLFDYGLTGVVCLCPQGYEGTHCETESQD
ncbi:lactadherin-like [Saccoglossus kowalevskii]|uniref:Protein jagged-1-like n=1 Tax=Saccoglossus kowalevskii TaxID=10224 RepID=A0ABM0MJV9_SACKO|nr:PREDICTED: protein jagged-1-like [Saccoglossus kowalevskii]